MPAGIHAIHRASTAAACLLLGLALVSLASGAPAQAADSVRRSLVKIHASSNPPDPAAPWRRLGPEESGGSGVIIEGNRVLTASHVIADAVMIEVQRSGLGKRYTARVEYACHTCDLAILSVADPSFFAGAVPLKIGRLPGLQEKIEVQGFPIGGEGLSVTSGIVSRVGVEWYTQSGRQLLLVQVDAALNPGNSGSPAIADGRLVGIAIQGASDAENIGYIVPPPIIQHFLDDVEDGRFDGFPELDVFVQDLSNPALREALGVADIEGGVLVTAVSRSGSAHGKLRPGDVLLEIDGVAVGEDNRVELADDLRIDATAVEHRAQVGESIDLVFHRDGTRHSTSIVMREPTPLVPMGDYDRELSFRIYGGLVFQRLTVRYLGAFDDAPSHLEAYWRDPARAEYEMRGSGPGAGGRREIVVLSNVLRSELTRSYRDLEDRVIQSVNGERVRDLRHLSDALDAAVGPFVTIETEQGEVLAFRRDQATAANPQILEQFGIVSDRSKDLVQAPASLAD